MSGQRYSVTIDVGANINQVKNAAAEMQQIFNSINFDMKNSTGISRLFNELNKALGDLQQKSNTALTGITDSRQVEKSVDKVNSLFKTLGQEFQLLGQSAPKELAQAVQGFSDKMSQAVNAQKEYSDAISRTRTEAEKLSKTEKIASDKVSIAQKKRQEIIDKQNQILNQKKKNEDIVSVREQTRAQRGNFADNAARVEAEIQKIAAKYRENGIRTTKAGFINENDIKKLKPEDLEEYKKQAEALKMYREELAKYDAETAKFKKEIASEDINYKNQNKALEEQEKKLKDLQNEWENAEKALKKFNQAGKEADVFEKLKESFTKIFGGETFKDVKNIDELNEVLKQLANTTGGDVASKLKKITDVLSSTNAPMEKTKQVITDTTKEFQKLSETDEEIDHLTSRLKYFFSLAGGFNLMRRAIRSAVTTTKELDAVMTQTAVVSQYSVSDMWKTLPQYSKEAQKLGVAIKDVYSAQTLYVQQGLDMNSAMQIGIETMKMARVANIGAEEATNSMTAALRGFNMELTERSAKRINDVYSKLAQNTASNTQEISTAMTKTAALANSANMSFENTSAFLATIIESTREGAETAGTALKTVIARFTEVKKLYSKGELTGTDEEGQEVNVNKISAALRTAGINMNDFFTGAKGLDEIFMELGSKWDSLTTVQQRYIATMAAGSRQQSRFLALMQNYNRTLELSSMAYNSAGSGQEQFDKTLESLEAKLARLKDAWATFVMGIANSDAIKGIVDAGTWILDTINNIIEKISGGNGLVKAVLSIGTAFATFKTGGALLKGTLGSLKESFIFNKKQEKEIAGGLIGRFIYGKKQIGQKLKSVGQGIKNPLFTIFSKNGKKRRQTIVENIKTNTETATKAKDTLATEEAELEEIKKSEVGEGEKYKYHTEEEKESAIKGQTTKVEEAQTAFTEAQDKQKTSTEQAVASLNNYGAALGAVAVAAGVAAGALKLWANSLEESGNEEASAAVSGLAAGLGALSVGAGLASSAMTAMASAVSVGAMTAKAATAAIPFVGWALVAVTAITAITVAIEKYHKTTKEKLEDSKKALEEQQANLNDIKNRYSEINETLNRISEQQDALSKMTEGTLEWDSAVKSLNENIQQFVENFPEFRKALKFDKETGKLILDKSEVEEIQLELKNQVELAQSRVDALKIATAYYTYKKATEIDFSTIADESGIAKPGVGGLTALITTAVNEGVNGPRRLSDEGIKGFSEALKRSLEKNGNGLGMYTSAQIRGWKDYIPEEDYDLVTSFLNAVGEYGPIGNEGYFKVAKEDWPTEKSSVTPNKKLAYLFERMADYYEQVEQYDAYQAEIEALGRQYGQTYIAENGKYNGIVRDVILEKSLDIYKTKATEDIGSYKDYVEDWLESQGYSDYKKKGFNFSYKDKEGNIQTKTYRSVKEEVSRFQATRLAKQAQQEEIDRFLQELAGINKTLISGKGTYQEYLDLQTEMNESGTDFQKEIAKEFVDNFTESMNKLSKIMETDIENLPDSFNNLELFQTENIANLATTWQKKFGKEQARNFLEAIGKYLGSDIEDISTVTDNLIYVLSQVESGAISNLEEFTEALWKYGIEGFEFDGIEAFFKKPKGFEKAQENLKSNLALWNTARSSTVFSQEDRDKLLASGMKRGDFILTSQGYVSTKSSAATSGAVKGKMIEDVESEISALKTQISSVQNFNKNYNKGFSDKNVQGKIDRVLKKGNIEEYIKHGNDILADRGQEAVKVRQAEVKEVLRLLVGEEIYNPNDGGTINLSLIDDEDLADYLQYYLDNTGNIQTWMGQKGSLELELGEIKNNKLLDLAPTIQSAIVDIITRATEKGINVSDKDIDKFIGGRAQFGSDKKYSEFLGGLEQLDWDEIDDIDDFIEKLKELGIEFYNTGKDAKDLYTRLKEIYASDSSTTEKADKKIKKLTSGKSAAEKIASGETTLSDSEFKDLRDILKESGSFVENDWVRTGLDEWTYVGNDTNSILMNIDSGVQAIAAEIINEAQDAVDKGQQIRGALKKEVGSITVLSTEGDITKGAKKTVTVSDVIKGLKEGKTYTQDVLNQTGQAIGLQPIDFDNLEIPADAITSYYDKYYGDEKQAYAANLKRYSELSNSAVLPYLYTSPQALLNAAAAGEDNGALRAQVVNNDLVAKVDYLKENAIYGDIFTKISAVPENSDEYDAAAAAMKGYEIGLEALALASDQAQKNIADLNATINENIDILKNSPKGSDAYIKAIDKVWKKAKKVFGENITKDFIEDNLPDFEAWAKGGEKGAAAFKKLSGAWSEKLKSGFKDFGKEIGIDGKYLTVLEEHWSELDGSTLEIGATADFTDLFSQMDLTQQEGEKLAEYLSNIPGITAIWVPGEQITLGDGSTVQTGHLQIVKDDGSGGSGKSGGGGGGKKFKNDFDKYYNQVEDINELERQRNLLEKDYQQLLKAQSKSGAEIYNNLKKQIELLEKQRELVADLAEKRKGQLFDVMEDEEYKSVWKYAKWNDEDQTIEIDWDAINKIKNSKEGDLVKEYIKKLEEYQKMYDEQIEKLEDIEDSIQEIKERGKEEYQNLEDRTRDALIKQIQDKIDELTDVNEAINDTNQKLFDKISETLELQRQDRENQKTEEELSDKEKRLAYLRQDSSNANQVEIAQLEKELDEAREDYTDTLIDQKISELQKQNEKAQEQREEQIELMQQSLDWQEKNGMFWEQAYALMSNSIGPDGTLVRGSQLEELLKRGEGWQSLSEFGQMNWLSELEALVAQAIGFLSLNRQLENIGVKEGTQVTFTNKEGKILTGTVDKDGNVIVTNEDGTSIYKGVYQDYNGKYTTLETEEEAKNNVKNNENNEENNEESSSGSGSGKNTKDWAVDSSGKTATVSKKNNQGQYYSKSDAEAAANALNSWDVKYENGKYVAVAVSSGQGVTKSWAESEAKKLNEQFESSSKVPTQYATGGLNTETGLAWLDGTKSHPELVLNSRDTENFIELKDTLTSLKSSGGLSLTGGENYYDIDIQVDSLGSDYDVDRMIDRIKSRIVQDNAYRNVNTLSRLR